MERSNRNSEYTFLKQFKLYDSIIVAKVYEKKIYYNTSRPREKKKKYNKDNSPPLYDTHLSTFSFLRQVLIVDHVNNNLSK